jgi:hypothetical protein
VAATYQKLQVYAIRCLRNSGAAEMIIDRAGWEDGQKVEKGGRKKKLTSGSSHGLQRTRKETALTWASNSHRDLR